MSERAGSVFVAGDFPDYFHRKLKWKPVDPPRRLGSGPVVAGLFHVERVDGVLTVLPGGILSAREAVLQAQSLAGWDDVMPEEVLHGAARHA